LLENKNFQKRFYQSIYEKLINMSMIMNIDYYKEVKIQKKIKIIKYILKKLIKNNKSGLLHPVFSHVKNNINYYFLQYFQTMFEAKDWTIKKIKIKIIKFLTTNLLTLKMRKISKSINYLKKKSETLQLGERQPRYAAASRTKQARIKWKATYDFQRAWLRISHRHAGKKYIKKVHSPISFKKHATSYLQRFAGDGGVRRRRYAPIYKVKMQVDTFWKSFSSRAAWWGIKSTRYSLVRKGKQHLSTILRINIRTTARRKSNQARKRWLVVKKRSVVSKKDVGKIIKRKLATTRLKCLPTSWRVGEKALFALWSGHPLVKSIVGKNLYIFLRNNTTSNSISLFHHARPSIAKTDVLFGVVRKYSSNTSTQINKVFLPDTTPKRSLKDNLAIGEEKFPREQLPLENKKRNTGSAPQAKRCKKKREENSPLDSFSSYLENSKFNYKKILIKMKKIKFFKPIFIDILINVKKAMVKKIKRKEIYIERKEKKITKIKKLNQKKRRIKLRKKKVAYREKIIIDKVLFQNKFNNKSWRNNKKKPLPFSMGKPSKIVDWGSRKISWRSGTSSRQRHPGKKNFFRVKIPRKVRYAITYNKKAIKNKIRKFQKLEYIRRQLEKAYPMDYWFFIAKIESKKRKIKNYIKFAKYHFKFLKKRIEAFNEYFKEQEIQYNKTQEKLNFNKMTLQPGEGSVDFFSVLHKFYSIYKKLNLITPKHSWSVEEKLFSGEKVNNIFLFAAFLKNKFNYLFFKYRFTFFFKIDKKKINKNMQYLKHLNKKIAPFPFYLALESKKTQLPIFTLPRHGRVVRRNRSMAAWTKLKSQKKKMDKIKISKRSDSVKMLFQKLLKVFAMEKKKSIMESA